MTTANPIESQQASEWVTVEVADLKVVQSGKAVLTTHALGSCLGVTVYDPVAKVGGMLHYMLPNSAMNPAKARVNPCMFGDTGIPLLIRSACELGAEKQRLVVKLAGGGNVLGDSHFFDIGKENYLAAQKILQRSGALVAGEMVGGTSGKTMRLYMNSGRVTVRMPNGEEQEI